MTQLLKLFLANLFEELIFILVFCLQGFAIYSFSIFLDIISEDDKSLVELVYNLVIRFLPKFITFFLLLVFGQILLLVDLKRTEINLEGGTLGFETTQRDKMKLQHFEMIEKINF